MKPLTSIIDALRMMQEGPFNPKALNDLKGNEWQSYSTEQILKEVEEIALGLMAIGIYPGECVAIFAHPSAVWAIIDLAIMSIGAITVPIFTNISVENFQFEVTFTAAKHIFVGSLESEEMYSAYFSSFEKIIYLDNHQTTSSKSMTYAALLECGRELNQRHPELYAQLKQAITPETLATIVFTSGSTGIPKGVEISHRALVSLIHVESFHWSAQDRYLNILPLAHIYGRVLNLILLSWRVSIYYCIDVKQMGAICREIHPTILVVVPRILEKLYAKMLSEVDQAGFMKRTLGRWAFEIAANEKESIFKTLAHPVLDKIIYSSLREALGGSLKVVICGGASIDPHLCHFFVDIGIPLYQGWGLTEASCIAINLPDRNKIGTVGTPLPGIQVKLSTTNELFVKGDLLMRGYYKDPEATHESIDSEGWLHTGDLGSIGAEGYITILGRLKEIYKTSTGENITPIPIERTLCKAPLIDMALVVANNRQFASCLLFPDLNVLHRLKNVHNLQDQSDEEFLQSSFIKDEINRLLEAVNGHLNHWEQIHAYRFILTPLSVQSGELTPSLKICRNVVLEKYKDLIDEIYNIPPNK